MSDRLTQLQKLFDADPKDAFLAYGIALEHAKTGRLTDTISWLDKALAIDPGYCYAYFQKAKAHSQLGQEVEAIATLDTGLRAARDVGDDKALGELAELRATLEM